MDNEWDNIKIGSIVEEKYRIARRIEPGGGGPVFSGFDIRTKKVIQLRFYSARDIPDKEALDNRMEEAKRARELCGEIITLPGQWGMFEGIPYVVHDFANIRTMEQIFKRVRESSETDTKAVVEKLLKTLMAVHVEGLLHLGISSLSIHQRQGTFFTLEPGILDFALAPRSGHSYYTYPYTADKSLVGVAAYVAPEQIEENGQVDQRTDLYSVGALIYRLIMGEAPFKGGGTEEILGKVTSEMPEGLDDSDTAISMGAKDFLATALQKDPQERFQSASEMMDSFYGSRASRPASRPPPPPKEAVDAKEEKKEVFKPPAPVEPELAKKTAAAESIDLDLKQMAAKAAAARELRVSKRTEKMEGLQPVPAIKSTVTTKPPPSRIMPNGEEEMPGSPANIPPPPVDVPLDEGMEAVPDTKLKTVEPTEELDTRQIEPVLTREKIDDAPTTPRKLQGEETEELDTSMIETLGQEEEKEKAAQEPVEEKRLPPRFAPDERVTMPEPEYKKLARAAAGLDKEPEAQKVKKFVPRPPATPAAREVKKPADEEIEKPAALESGKPEDKETLKPAVSPLISSQTPTVPPAQKRLEATVAPVSMAVAEPEPPRKTGLYIGGAIVLIAAIAVGVYFIGKGGGPAGEEADKPLTTKPETPDPEGMEKEETSPPAEVKKEEAPPPVEEKKEEAPPPVEEKKEEAPLPVEEKKEEAKAQPPPAETKKEEPLKETTPAKPPEPEKKAEKKPEKKAEKKPEKKAEKKTEKKPEKKKEKKGKKKASSMEFVD